MWMRRRWLWGKGGRPLRRLCRVEFFFERIQKECSELDVGMRDRVLHCFGPRSVCRMQWLAFCGRRAGEK